MCGILANKEKFDEVPDNVFRESSRINSTFGGNFIDMMRLKLILEVIEQENLVQHAEEMGTYLLEGLQRLEQQYPQYVSAARGKGLMCAFNLPTAELRNKVQSQLYQDKVIILGCGERALRFRPHLNVSKDEIQTALERLEQILQKEI